MTPQLLDTFAITGVVIILLIVAAMASAMYQRRVLAAIAGTLSMLVAGLTGLMNGLRRGFSALASLGRRLRQLKDDRFEQWVDHWMPFTADMMTTLRLVFIGLSIAFFQDQKPDWAITFFTLGWVFDLTDGLKAAAETKRRGYPTKHGKYFDPIVDIICFAGLTWWLAPSYPRRLIAWFVIGLLMRSIMFLIIVAGRRWWGWKDRLASDILPHSIAGQFKTVFAALSFGLILLVDNPPTNLIWATWLLGAAAILENLSFVELGRGLLRDLNRRPVVSTAGTP